MAWFAAHTIFYFEVKDGPQDSFSIWENVYLIRGIDSDDAWEKAAIWARENEGDSDGSLLWNERPATLRFAGIRKLISVSHWEGEGRLEHRDEITYSEFEVADRESIDRLVAGDEVDLRYVE